MKKTNLPSIDREAFWFLLVMLSLIVTLYSFFLMSYFERGLVMSTKGALLMEARGYAKAAQQGSEASLPNSYHIKTYQHWQDLPNSFQENFSSQGLVHEQFEYIEIGGKDGEPQLGMSLLAFDVSSQQRIYLTSVWRMNDFTLEDTKEFWDSLREAPSLAFGSIMTLILLSVLISRRFSQDTKKLYSWSHRVDIHNYQNELPSFRYRETHEMASSLQQALKRVSQLVEREHYFLRHASHELRTPIAVQKAGLELLEKQGLPPAFHVTVARLQRTNKNMQKLVETLLWSSQETSPNVVVKAVDLVEKLAEITSDLDYLLEGKTIQVKQELPLRLHVTISETPWVIVVSNLVKNAFQYTQQGNIDIRLSQNEFIVHNKDLAPEALPQNEQSFGLGLMLVRELCQRLGWQLIIKAEATGLYICLRIIPE